MDELNLKQRILKLCKRLDRFMFDDIQTIADDIELEVLELLLETLIAEKKLIRQDEMYLYNKEKSSHLLKARLPMIFQYYDNEKIDIIIRCYSSNIPIIQTGQITEIGESGVGRFYQIFRKKLYLRQELELKTKYKNDPQYSRNRMFFNKEIYFYTYDNNIYVIEKPFKSDKQRFLTKVEDKEFKKVYCYISRALVHNKNEYFLHHKIAEAIWRRNKSFDEMYSDMKNLLFS